jgi:hypothetical protein
VNFHKDNKKDLDSWKEKQVKIIFGDSFYEGIFKGELKNGYLLENKGKRIYISFESVVSIEEV